MKVSRGALNGYAIAIAILVLPLLAAFLLRPALSEPWQPNAVVVGLTILPVLAGFLLVGRSSRLRAQRAARPPRPDDVERELRLTAQGVGFYAIAEIIFVLSVELRVGVALLILYLAWVLVWTPRAMRRVVMRPVVQVRCEPQAAFAVVSNPNNWPKYIPELEIVQPVEVPVRLGTVFGDRVHGDRAVTLEAQERVIVYEPGVSFGTTLENTAVDSSGISVFRPVGDGTEIEYTHRSTLTLSSAVFGTALRRPGLVRLMAAHRAQLNERLKRLLEESDGAAV